ncbi:unnamed protein product [Prorocentrum cordatum]|uniref:Phosphoglycerate kinase n=1 Tax=Prorocentrum cordatum TaxID=2364126 RepID=A0ABN9S759_9DINO|nr:unnamed protein product [Polarella glacialis]
MIDLKGAAAVLTEKDKPATMSDGKLVRGAGESGAQCVIKVGGGGSMLYSVPDPVEIPCLAMSLESGESLIQALNDNGGKSAGHARIVGLEVHDMRASLQQLRRPEGSVWVALKGLRLRGLERAGGLRDLAAGHARPRGAPVYEDYFESFRARKSTDPSLGTKTSKLRRIVESAWSPLKRAGIADNPAMMGKLLAIGAQPVEFDISHIRFSPSTSKKYTTCAMLVSGTDASPLAQQTLAMIAHEAVYVALMGQFTRLMDFMAPSLWNFLKCVNGDFFGWEADASKVRKLFTPCSGRVGPEPKEQWQKDDPTWQIVDERNAIGIVVRTQGRLLWRERSAVPEEKRPASGAADTSSARAESKDSHAVRLLGRWSTSMCCSR